MRGDAAAADPAYKLFDERGDVLVLRSDMTIPIARVVATRYPSAEPPLRFCYFAPAYRSVQPQRGQPREVLPGGHRAGRRARAGGHGGGAGRAVRVAAGGGPGELADRASATRRCTRGCWTASACRTARGRRSCTSWSRATTSAWRARSSASARPSCSRCPSAAAAPEILDTPETEPLAAVHALLPEEVAGRLIFDLGLTRSLGYYTGAVFEVYDAALGTPLGGGGRYDDLLGRFGRDLPAFGWALDVERLHAARVGEGR